MEYLKSPRGCTIIPSLCTIGFATVLVDNSTAKFNSLFFPGDGIRGREVYKRPVRAAAGGHPGQPGPHGRAAGAVPRGAPARPGGDRLQGPQARACGEAVFVPPQGK